MDEDVEIDLLYKTHGEVLMEAAATEHVDGEDSPSAVCGGDPVTSVKRKVPGKKCSSRKRRKKLTRRAKKGKNLSYTLKKEVHDDSATDLEDLLDARIVSCKVAGGSKSRRGWKGEIDTYFDGDDEIKRSTGKTLESSLREVCPESEGTEIEKDDSGKSDDKCILDLMALQDMIDKRDELLEKLERKLMDELVRCKREQSDVRKTIKQLSQNEICNKREPNLTKCFFKKFGMPYFHDNGGFAPPPNDDYKQKLKSGELISSSIPRLRYWRKSHKDKLQDAIQLTLIQENTDRLIKVITKLQDGLVNVPDEQTETEILGKIVEHQKELQRTKSMSCLDLLAKENPDREYDWMKYSAVDLNGVHSSEDCQRFWHLYLKPTINKSNWDKNENKKLKEIAEQMNFQDWESIAKKLGTNRTAYLCAVHYRNKLCDKQQFIVGKWSKEEDEKLLNVINNSKIGDVIPWSKVASYMGDRKQSQIYNRYVNCLDPKLVKGRFSKEEDLLIVSGVEVFRASYKELASLMNNRTANQIRDRYERHLLPKTSKTGTFSLEEDEKLLMLVEKYNKNFVLVADEMKTRTRTQVRQRYNCMMRRMETIPGWTPAKVKRRSVHRVSKTLTNTKNRVDKLREEVNLIEKTFQLTKLESDAFRIGKLKELRDEIFMKKYQLGKFKKKSYPVKADISSALREYFTVPNNTIASSIRHNSVDNAAQLNEMMMLIKYFGHDVELPTCADEIQNNNRLSPTLKKFLIETLNEREVDPAADTQNSVETSSISVSKREPCNIDYVGPEVDDTLLIEERWRDAPVNVSSLNFSELFKRTVFDYSSGIHQDIWDSKMNRSKAVVEVFNDVINIPEPSNAQKYFIPPNSLTALGYKSLLLCKSRLTRDAERLPEENHVTSEVSPMYYALADNYQETMLSLYYCPKVLSVTDFKTTTMHREKIRSLSSSQSLKKHKGIVDLLNTSDQTESDIVSKAAKPIKNKALQEKKMKRTVLEHTRNHHRQLQEFRVGITYKRKMSIEHLVNDSKKTKTSTSSNTRSRTKLKGKKRKIGDDSFKVKKLKDGGNALEMSGSQKTNDDKTNQFGSLSLIRVPTVKVPTQTYSRTRQSLTGRLDSDKPSEPANKKSDCIDLKNTESTTPTNEATSSSDLDSTVNTELLQD